MLFFIFIAISCVEDDENYFEDLNDKKARIEGDVKIAYWYKGNSLALSFTWDDSLEKQFTTVAPIFDKYGYKASFFPYTDNYFKKKFVNGYRKIALSGHEIGSHTVNHKDLTSLPLDAVEYELTVSKKILLDSLNINPVSFIHPFNLRNESVNKLVLKYYAFSRYASLVSMDNRVIYTLMSNWSAKDGIDLINKFSNKQKWLILAGHSVDGDGYQPMVL